MKKKLGQPFEKNEVLCLNFFSLPPPVRSTPEEDLPFTLDTLGEVEQKSHYFLRS